MSSQLQTLNVVTHLTGEPCLSLPAAKGSSALCFLPFPIRSPAPHSPCLPIPQRLAAGSSQRGGVSLAETEHLFVGSGRNLCMFQTISCRLHEQTAGPWQAPSSGSRAHWGGFSSGILPLPQVSRGELGWAWEVALPRSLA